MLGDPEMDGGCIAHQAAAQIYHSAPHTYKQMALDCITASLRIDGILMLYSSPAGFPLAFSVIVYMCMRELYEVVYRERRGRDWSGNHAHLRPLTSVVWYEYHHGGIVHPHLRSWLSVVPHQALYLP